MDKHTPALTVKPPTHFQPLSLFSLPSPTVYSVYFHIKWTPLLDTKLRSGLCRPIWKEAVDGESDGEREKQRGEQEVAGGKVNEISGGGKTWEQKSEIKNEHQWDANRIIWPISWGYSCHSQGFLGVTMNPSACHLYCSHRNMRATNFEVDGCALLKAPRPRILHFLWSTPILNLTAKLFEM